LRIAKIKKQKRRGTRIRRARRIRNEGAIDYTVNVTSVIIQHKWCGHAIQRATGAIGAREVFRCFSIFRQNSFRQNSFRHFQIVSDIFFFFQTFFSKHDWLARVFSWKTDRCTFTGTPRYSHAPRRM
jgi:hypothetical protein